MDGRPKPVAVSLRGSREVGKFFPPGVADLIHNPSRIEVIGPRLRITRDRPDALAAKRLDRL